MKTKFIKLVFASILMASLLVACGSAEDASPQLSEQVSEQLSNVDMAEPPVTSAPSAAESSDIEEPIVVEEASTDIKAYAVMEVFYATDRKEQPEQDLSSRFSGKRGEISYGVTEISIPREHKTGELESPSILKLEFRENPEKHIVMMTITKHDQAAFFQEISNKVSASPDENAFIFVHGYNVTFEDAARRTGQIAYDLKFAGAPVFYSWPSYGSTAKYTFDEANIKWAQTNIEKFLKDFAEKSTAKNIYLIAHSMGNRGLTRAYISLIDKNPDLKSRFTEIILAAPDIDAEVFKREIAPAMIRHGNPITLYASSEDIPLKASREIHGGYPRAGDSGQHMIVMPGMESIDSSLVNTSFLGHSNFADERAIVTDMHLILGKHMRASERVGLDEKTGPNGKYWAFRK